MAKDREIICKYYEYEGKCKKERAGTFRYYCQKCNKYEPLKGRAPARKNTRRAKLEKLRKEEY